MKKKKVLHIVESFGSGVFSFLVDLINCTDSEFEIVVAYGVRSETLPNFKDYFSDKVRFIKVDNFTRSINPIKDIKAVKEIKRIVKDEKPDIVHMHSSKAGIIGRIAINGRKVKMLYNPHGFSFLMKDSSKFKRLIYWWIEKLAALRKCTIVGCSKGEYEEALKLSKNAICINNGINIEKLEDCVKGLERIKTDFKNLKVCTCGRLGFQKNPEMFNKIAEQFPNIQFTWIGDGELREKLTSKNIKITGWMKREDVLEEVLNNDIFILASLWEGLPISLLEAMYLERICLVSNVIGNRDVINNEQNGFVCEKSADFCSVIHSIMDGKYDINTIVNNSKEDVIKKYDVKLMSEKYMKLYREESVRK